jgi:predicted permease
MQNVLLQMASLIVCGIGWKLAKPAGLDPVATRKVLTSLVYYLLLPALVLSILWKAELGANSLIIAASAAFGIAVGMLLSSVVCRIFNLPSSQAGALILAATFPNATYLGLPVLEATFGPWARSVAIQYDLFACTPLLFTIGIWLASRMGQQVEGRPHSYLDLLRIPAIWAVFLALILNGLNVQVPTLIDEILGLLNRGVVPLMLISLGLSLDWNASRWKQLPNLIPTILISLIIIPALVFAFTKMMGLSGDLRSAVVLEAAMPSMVLGIVLCDQFNLDVGLYASAVTVTTVLSMFSLPLWYGWLS